MKKRLPLIFIVWTKIWRHFSNNLLLCPSEEIKS